MDIDLSNPELDRISLEKRQQIIEKVLENQVRYSYNQCEFYKKRFDSVGIKPKSITFKEFEEIPTLTKQEILSSEVNSILPEEYQKVLSNGQKNLCFENTIYRVYFTSGTTGSSLDSFYTFNDWMNCGDCITRMFDSTNLDSNILFNSLHVGHIAGAAGNDHFIELGYSVIPKYFKGDDKKALEQIRNYKCDAIFGVPHSAGKGGSIEELVMADKEDTSMNNIRTVFSTAAPMNAALKEALRGIGVEKIFELYGCSELGWLAMKCQENNGYHLMQGWIFGEVIDPKKGEHVNSGERGILVFTALNREGSQFIRYAVGDEATYIDEPCECGRTTPRIKDVERVEDLERLETGCRVWA